MMSYDVSYVDVLLKRVLSMVLVLWGADPILRNRYGNQGQKSVKSQRSGTPGFWY